MKKWKLIIKFKDEKNWIEFANYNNSITPIKRAKELIKVQNITKVKVTEIQEDTIYEEEGE